jgi:hypothetical protein
VSNRDQEQWGWTRTLELLVQLTTAGDAECTNKLLEVDSAVLVLIEDIEHIIGELVRVTKGEELPVDTPKLRLIELATGTVLQEAFVPA